MSVSPKLKINGKPYGIPERCIDNLRIFSDLAEVLEGPDIDLQIPVAHEPYIQAVLTLTSIFALIKTLAESCLDPLQSLDEMIGLISALSYFGCPEKLVADCAKYFMDKHRKDDIFAKISNVIDEIPRELTVDNMSVDNTSDVLPTSKLAKTEIGDPMGTWNFTLISALLSG